QLHRQSSTRFPTRRSSDLEELVGEIGAAGRAAVFWNGEKWTGVIDKARTTIVDHFNPRNASNFRWGALYFERPDAYRVRFADETDRKSTRLNSSHVKISYA